MLFVCPLELVKNELSFMSKDNNERNKNKETRINKREQKQLKNNDNLSLSIFGI